MKYYRTRSFNRKDGKFSIWVVVFGKNDIRRLAKKHPQHLTVPSCLILRVSPSDGNPGKGYVARLSELGDENNIIKQYNFKSSHVLDDDLNCTVTFEIDQPVKFYDPSSNATTKNDYYFSYLQTGFHSGSFYRMVDDLIRGGNFSDIDGSDFVNKKAEPVEITEDKLNEILEWREKITTSKKSEYGERDKEKAKIKTEEN